MIAALRSSLLSHRARQGQRIDSRRARPQQHARAFLERGPGGEHVVDQHDAAPARVAAAEDLLGRVNQLVDAAERYSGEMVEACLVAFQSLSTTFAEERAEAEQSGKLGPMLPGEYREARRIFLEDLAAR